MKTLPPKTCSLKKLLEYRRTLRLSLRQTLLGCYLLRAAVQNADTRKHLAFFPWTMPCPDVQNT